MHNRLCELWGLHDRHSALIVAAKSIQTSNFLSRSSKRQKGMCMDIKSAPLKAYVTRICLLAFLGNLFNNTHANECLIPCENTFDYQHPNSFLHFSRNHYSKEDLSGSIEEASTNGSWRHRFDIVITQDGPQLTVFDEQGLRHTFNANESGQYNPLSESSGTLTKKNGEFHWTNSNAVHHKFQGSYLTEITSPDNETLRLQYTQQKLNTISNAYGDSISLNYHDNSLASLTTPDGRTVELANDVCLTQTYPETCDTEQQPLANFQTNSHQSNVIRVDARPVSCESYFIEYFGTTRGSEIELGLSSHPPYRHMQTTVRSFPIIDFINGNQWIAVRSRDLASPSFNDADTPNALFYRLMRDGREIQDRFLSPLEENGFVTAEEDGVTTTLEAGVDPQNLVLQLVIRHQIASTAHWQQITRARELLAQRYNIELEVVIIP